MVWIIPVMIFLMLLFFFWWFQNVNQQTKEDGENDFLQHALAIFTRSIFKKRRILPGMMFSGTMNIMQRHDPLHPTRTPVDEPNEPQSTKEPLPDRVPVDEPQNAAEPHPDQLPAGDQPADSELPASNESEDDPASQSESVDETDNHDQPSA